MVKTKRAALCCHRESGEKVERASLRLHVGRKWGLVLPALVRFTFKGQVVVHIAFPSSGYPALFSKKRILGTLSSTLGIASRIVDHENKN